jgi:hypothetical protein
MARGLRIDINTDSFGGAQLQRGDRQDAGTAAKIDNRFAL